MMHVVPHLLDLETAQVVRRLVLAGEISEKTFRSSCPSVLGAVLYTRMDFAAVLERIANRLECEGQPLALVGGLGLAAWGSPARLWISTSWFRRELRMRWSS